MVAPYSEKTPKDKTSLRRLLGLSKEEAIIELNNLLAHAKELKQVSSQDIDAIASKYHIDFRKEFSEQREGFYSAYLEHCLADSTLSDDELVDLSHLKALLSLSDGTVH